MSAKRAHFSSSVKTIPDAQPNRRTASLQHQKSFNGEDDPEAASIRSTFPAAQKPSEEQETTSDNDEANTTFVTQQTINLDPEDDEKPILERPQVHAASLSTQENLGPYTMWTSENKKKAFEVTLVA
ncbi:hypothetical protein KI688_009047 [Linnemannia hyalina]|uniref:Uncharacterized protein n=1 Tax=Linnemannia hyalina TaxID=64524 RepID=A0A9P7XGH6_9FUNG|nr:hypothetical protein KI688_007846 [Linnemannia hyalina]KAG9061899.1 hypothetical protein KI688_007050 [Linnemannia hyalina]KAG9062582.1 hypothetical protein KI688_004884 [Linnemannia hyalina]KAG9069723.1 hypothetical protein KI688_009047 [Linnemannia hyalina]